MDARGKPSTVFPRGGHVETERTQYVRRSRQQPEHNDTNSDHACRSLTGMPKKINGKPLLLNTTTVSWLATLPRVILNANLCLKHSSFAQILLHACHPKSGLHRPIKLQYHKNTSTEITETYSMKSNFNATWKIGSRDESDTNSSETWFWIRPLINIQ